MTLAISTPPIRVTHWGAVYTTSRDVAGYFGKEHRNVLRDIDRLIVAEPSLGLLNFEQGSYTLAATGSQAHRQFMMDRDGFVLLVMGFTGAKALAFKLAYIRAFNEMEEAYYYPKAPRGADSIDFADPAIIAGVLRHLSDVNGERLAPAAREAPAIEAPALPAPVAPILDRRQSPAGSALCITDAAKILHVGRAELTRQLQAMRWIYKRTGGKHWLAYEDKRRAGYLEHDETRYGGRISPRALITPKGLEKLKAQRGI